MKCKECGKEIPETDDVVMYLSKDGWKKERYCEECLKKIELVK